MWLLGGTGVFLIYAAYKNQQPQALLESHISGKAVDKPISNYTTSTVPTITGPNGTYNTAPGDGGYITTDPPTPENPWGSGGGTMLGGLLDSAGKIIGTVPAGYKKSVGTFIS